MGALLVVVVLSAAMTVPVLGGLRTSGTAAAAEPHPAPQLGDCLRERPAALNAAPVGLRAPAPAEAESQRAPTLGPLGPTAVPCAGGTVAGEVILTVSADGDPPDVEGAVAESGINCRLAALAYAGLRSAGSSAEATLPLGMPDSGAADGPVTWKMTINMRSTWVYPSALQRAAGHRWAACVAAPPVDRLYTGSLAGALSGGHLPANFSTCWYAATVTPAVESVDCGRPHLSELLSAGIIRENTRVSTDEVRAACTRLAIAATGRVDPTDGGRLIIKTQPERMYDSQLDRSVSVLCYLATADQPLDGTLIGLHDRPVPFAN